MTRRLLERVACTGRVILPAVPALVDEYAKLCAKVFAASGRGFVGNEDERARRLLAEQLTAAFAGSPRSKIEICFEAESARPLGYSVKPEVRTISDAYERWIGPNDEPLFGTHPDARVLSLATRIANPESSPILDFGAGTGRNALALARLGHPVDAVEIAPKFAEMLSKAANAEGLSVRVIVDDVFRNPTGLRHDYRLLFASEVVPDFRGVADLRCLFELAAKVLCDGGLLLFNVHLCATGFTPEKAARELAQQCYSCLFTPNEVVEAASSLPFARIADDSVHDFEKEHLPPGAFPPTPWYENWTTGRDVYEIEQAQCPVEMRWLVFEKRRASPELTAKTSRPRRFDPLLLRKGLVRRLTRRLNASGTLTLPAVPAMLDAYTTMCESLFAAIDRAPGAAQTESLKSHLALALREAYAQSQRSHVVLTYEAPFDKDLHYTITADPIPLAEAYAQWHQGLGDAMFGVPPDARLLALLTQMPEPSCCPVLDIGAGLGRNALYLAQHGYSVDAVEITPLFAESLQAEAIRQKVPVRVVSGNILEKEQALRRDYRLMLLSGTVGDLRDLGQVRRVFEIAAEVLVPGGLLLLSVHVAVKGYTPDLAAHQWAQQCSAFFITREELSQATAGLPLALLSDASAHDYEQTHLPEGEWPPTPVFTEWALAQHMYALDRDQCPIELRWLLFCKRQSTVEVHEPL